MIGQFRIAHRIIARSGAEPIVLDQLVIGIAREGDRREFEGVDQRQPMERQTGMEHGQGGLIEGNDVVSEQAGRSVGQRIDLGDQTPILAGNLQSCARVGTVQADLAQLQAVVAVGFDVEAEQRGFRGRGRLHPVSLGSGRCPE